MPRFIRFAFLLLLAASAVPCAAATWRYHGTLNDSGRPANGDYGFRLTLYDAAIGGNPIDGAISLENVQVTNGVFTTKFDIGDRVQSYSKAWLAVEVRDAGGAYLPLSARQLVQPQITPGDVCWSTQGNGGTATPTNFLGTTDNHALQIKVNSVLGWSLLPTTSTPNVVGGLEGNGVSAGVVGATIAGGGKASFRTNIVSDNYGTVAGGENNVAGDAFSLFADNIPTSSEGATVAGGEDNIAARTDSSVGGGVGNQAFGQWSSVPGGAFNMAGGDYSLAAGHQAKVRASVVVGSVPAAPSALGDYGTFVWSDALASNFVSSGPNQFLVRAFGGVGFNTNLVPALVNISDIGPPFRGASLQLFSSMTDNPAGAIVRWTENGVSSSGAYAHYEANTNMFTLGVDLNGTDTDKIFLPRSGIGVGIGQEPTTFALEVNGNALKTSGGNTWAVPSDGRIKTDVRPIEHALDTILKLNPVSFRYADDFVIAHQGASRERVYNVIAQEFAGVFPEAVHASGEYLSGSERGEADRILTVDINPALITGLAAIQELAVALRTQVDRVDALVADSQRLRDANETLSARLSKLEAGGR